MSKKWYNYFVVSTPTGAASDGTPPPGDPRAPTRVADLVADATGDATFVSPVTTSNDLSEIYLSAQIPVPAHGYTALKVADMLQSDHIRALPAEVKQKSIMVALDAAGVTVAEIVEDAVRRDRALDTYERVLRQNLEDLRSQKDLDNQRLEDEIGQRVAELRGRIDQNNAETTREQHAVVAWCARKRQEEDRIAEVVGYFVSPNPITTSTMPVKDKGGADVR